MGKKTIVYPALSKNDRNFEEIATTEVVLEDVAADRRGDL